MNRIAVAVVLAALSGAPPSLAGEARASGNAPVRDGPGLRYSVIDHLESGADYTIEDCTRQSRWCLVSRNGDDLGWVRGSYLVGAAAKNAATPFEFLVRPNLLPTRP